MTVKVGGVEFDVDVDSSGVVSGSSKINSSLEGVESAFKQVDNAATQSGNKMSQAATKSSKAMGQLRQAAGQLGFQVQDAAVQFQMGTNALVILGQQGSQVAGIFGPTGAIVGGVIAVGSAIAGMMVPSMMEAGNKTEELTEKLKELGKTNELTINQQKFLKQVEGDETKAKAEKIKALEDEAKEIKDAGNLGLWYNAVVRNLAAGQAGLASVIAREVVPELTEEKKRLVEIAAELDTLNEKTGGAKIDPEKNKQALKEYSKRVAFMQSSLNMEGEILSAANVRMFEIQRQGGDDRLALIDEQLAARRARLEFQAEQDLIGFEEERQRVADNENLKAEEKAALIEEFNELEKQAKQQHENELTNIEMDAAKAREAVAEQERKARENAMKGMFSNLSSLMNVESRKLFEIGKAAAVSSAVVDGYKAVAKTMAETPYPLNVAFAAAQAAASFAQVKGILSTNYGSAGTGQSYSSGQVATNTASTQQTVNRNISISLAGSGSYTGGDIRALISEINEELGDGATLNITGG